MIIAVSTIFLIFKIDKIWTVIPQEATTLLQRMLIYEPEKRITAKEALQNSWLAKIKDANASFTEARICLKRLKFYQTQTILQRTVLSYFATVDLMPKEEKKLQEYFALFDLDHDGKLSEQDLVQGYTRLYSNNSKAKFVVKNIMKSLDLKKNGTINFTGNCIYYYYLYIDFAAANLQLNRYIQTDKLKEAFNFLDKDGDGFITVNELEMLFGDLVVDKPTLHRVIQEGISNGDDKLSFEKFTFLMEKYKAYSTNSYHCDSD